MKCCGVDCISPYCPSCGKSLGKAAAFGLLQHCRKMLAQYQERLNYATARQTEAQRDGSAGGLDLEVWICRVANKQRLVDKWDDWFKVVEAAAKGA